MRLLCFCCKSLVDALNLAQWLLRGWSGVDRGLVDGCLRVDQRLVGLFPARFRHLVKVRAGGGVFTVI